MRLLFLAFIGTALTVLSGCAAYNYTEADAPRALLSVPKREPAPKIAVVLGSGGPRGYAHVGVIKALEEAGIRPDLIVGSSVGALLGAVWADGKTAKHIEEQAFSGGPLTLFDINPFADRGWIRGEKLQRYADAALRGQRIEQLKTPLVLVATRMADKTPVFFTQGNLGVAVRASSAVAGVISPVGIAGTEYEDGDESLPVAVRAARQAGAQFVIAVDVAAHAGSAPAGTSEKWLQKDQARRARIDPEVATADFLIHPDLGYKASPFRSFFVMANHVGYRTAKQQMPALKAKLGASIMAR